MKSFKSLFKLGGKISDRLSTVVSITGFFFIISIWYIITSATGWVKPQTIPSPGSVLSSFYELYSQDKGLVAAAPYILISVVFIFLLYVVPYTKKFMKSITDYIIAVPVILFIIFLLTSNFVCKDAPISTNIFYSLKLNFTGYIYAIAISVPLGFLISLTPLLRSMLGAYINAMRYIPLSGIIGIFIAWFGISIAMKVDFLAFGIIVYLLPMVVLRVYETEKIHLDTIYTLGANSWQTFTRVYWPSTMSKIIPDIGVITAVSYTYIIIAEMVNNEGGVGAMIYTSAKQSRLDKIFALILIIIAIGFLQDIFSKWLDKKLYKFKHV